MHTPRISLKAALIAALFTPPCGDAGFLSGRLCAQLAPPFQLEWQRRDAPATIPAGDNYSFTGWTGGTPPEPIYTAQATNGGAQTLATSGKDWWHSMVLIHDANLDPLGYVAVGYTSHVNWGYNDGCFNRGVGGFPSPVFAERFDRRQGAIRNAVARYDLSGNLVWFRTYLMDALFDVIQDSNGDLVVVGDAGNSTPLADMDQQIPIRFNPSTQNPNQQLPTSGCADGKRQFLVMKLDLDGDVLWHHVYSPLDVDGVNVTYNDVLARRSSGQGIVETDFNGVPGYKAVGFGMSMTDPENPFVVDVDINGLLINKQLHVHLPGAVDSNSSSWFSRALHIAKTEHNGEDHYLISGFRFPAADPWFDAFIWAFNESGNLFFKDTHYDAATVGASSGLFQNSSGGCFSLLNGNLRVVWPVMTDHSTNGTNYAEIFAGVNHQAQAKMQAFDLAGNALWSPAVDIGTIRALDLQLDVIETGNGDLAVSTTKWGPGLSPSTPFSYTNLPSAVQSCLADPNELGYDSNGSTADGIYSGAYRGVVDWTAPFNTGNSVSIADMGYFYGYWGTQSYVARYRPTDGARLWEYQWAEGSGATATTCFTDNFRQRQCNFDIVEAPDGGLLICGNVGHNLDDAYLAKLQPCDQGATYTNLPLDQNNEHHLTANTLWNSNKNIIGTIVVDPGVTLTINSGAVIRFADSRQVGITTRLVVRPGGQVLANGNSVLTSLAGCGNSMWDGIMVLGNPNLIQSPGNQGTVSMSNTTISNAFCGVNVGNTGGVLTYPFGAVTQQGGRVIMNSVTLRNNIHDVVMHPYVSQYANDYTLSKFVDCTFETTAALNYYWYSPSMHLYLHGQPRMLVEGCTFRNTSGLQPANPYDLGAGIYALNGTVVVRPSLNNASTFAGLARGYNHLNFVANKTARLENASFTGCASAAYLSGVYVPRVNGNTISVPDMDVSLMGLDAAYGIYLSQCTGFEVEENVVTGPGSGATNPTVGSVFHTTGPDANEYYNNHFDGLYAGTIIMGSNDGPNFDDGLHLKCNDYSNNTLNSYDVAFTGSGVSVGDQQGTNFDVTSPAGNTFAPFFDCINGTNTEQHFFVELGAINTFQYVHHAPSTTIQLVPDCATDPPIDRVAPGSWYSNSQFQYTKETACGTQQSAQESSSGLLSQAEAAHNEMQTLRAVYDNWLDGGNSEGLIAFIQNEANSSYAVRNELMLVAPQVSEKAWMETFARIATMNPWHLAQALVANSPLSAETMRLMEESAMDSYYRQLVNAAQNGGTSMQSIMESELAYFYQLKATALNDLTALALVDEEGDAFADAVLAHQNYPLYNSPQAMLAMYLAQGELAEARDAVNLQLVIGDLPEYWDVQDLYLDLLEAEQTPTDVDASGIALLETIALGEAFGAGHAQAWLALLDRTSVEPIILPGGERRSMPIEESTENSEMQLLSLFPNPSTGVVHVAATLPEGVDVAVLRVMDPLGRLVVEKRVTDGTALIDLPNGKVSGQYTLGLYLDGLKAETISFQIIR